MTELKIVKDPAEFDLESLRLDPSQLEAVSVKVPISIPCRKPPKFDWIRVHANFDRGARAEGGGRVLRRLARHGRGLGEDVSHFTLYPYINRVGVIRLWPVRLPAADGRVNEWHRSAAVAAALGQKKWIRVAANMSLGAYDVSEAVNQPPDPEWPDELGLGDMLRIAFHDRGRIINSMDHPVVKMLAGRL
jgi:hypothetical protein